MDLNRSVGYKSPPFATAWNRRDLLLYAVGIGAGRNELPFVYERDPNWHSFPTYPLVLVLKGAEGDISEPVDAGGPTPDFPVFEEGKGVHAEQSITILKEIPPVSGNGWNIAKQVVGVKHTAKGLIIDYAYELVSPSGEVYVRMIHSVYAFGKYPGNAFTKSMAPEQPAKGLSKPPSRAPDTLLSEKTSESQAIIYRLSGDYNPLHAAPELGESMGFGGAILHGLCSYGHAARAIVLKAADGDGRRLSYMNARFTCPVVPGDELETSMWISPLEDGMVRVDFIQKIKASGKVCLGGGVALLKKKAVSSKL